MKKSLVLLATTATYLSAAPLAFAADISTCPAGDFGPLCNFTFSNFIPNLVTTIFIISLIVALLYLIWGGFKWLTSGGDKAAVQQAREHIVAAVIGLVIVFLAYFIVNFVLGFFIAGKTINTLTLPQ